MPVPDPKSRTEGRRKVKIGSKEAHVTPFRGRKVKGRSLSVTALSGLLTLTFVKGQGQQAA